MTYIFFVDLGLQAKLPHHLKAFISSLAYALQAAGLLPDSLSQNSNQPFTTNTAFITFKLLMQMDSSLDFNHTDSTSELSHFVAEADLVAGHCNTRLKGIVYSSFLILK